MTRATAMAPADRRRCLAETVLELTLSTGAQPSTREIAARAGVAEGTVFRAFGTKDELLEAAISLAFCPMLLVAAIESIDTGGSFEGRLSQVLELLASHTRDAFQLSSILGRFGPPEHVETHDACTVAEGHVEGPRVPMRAAKARWREHLIDDAISRALGEDTTRLPLTASQTVALLRGAAFSLLTPSFTNTQTITSGELADILVHGLLHTTRTLHTPTPLHPNPSR